MRDLNDKITGDTLTATEWNDVPSELQNIIESTGIVLSSGDLQQAVKAVSVYSTVGDFYTGGGAVNAYTATVVAPRISPPSLVDGMRVRWIPSATNTIASTLNAFGTGVVSIKLIGGITNIVAGDIVSAKEAVTIYRTSPSPHFELENPKVSGVAIADSSETVKGIIELATSAEYATGTDTTRALTAAVARANNIVSGVSVAAASQTSIDFTGIPSWAKRITVIASAFSTNGTSKLLVQVGDSGGVENTGYVGSASGIASTVASSNLSSGFDIGGGSNATYTYNVLATMCLMNGSSNTWAFNCINGNVGITQTQICAGTKSLTAALDRVRITTVNGTDTFDAGSVNILWE